MNNRTIRGRRGNVIGPVAPIEVDCVQLRSIGRGIRGIFKWTGFVFVALMVAALIAAQIPTDPRERECFVKGVEYGKLKGVAPGYQLDQYGEWNCWEWHVRWVQKHG